MTRQPSLKRPLIVYPLVLHFVILLVSFLVIVSIAIRIDSGGPYADEQVVAAIARSIARDTSGDLSVIMTAELSAMYDRAPDMWFVVEDDAGESVTFGNVPEHFASFMGRLSDISFGQLRARSAPYDVAAVIRRETTEIGELTILGHGPLAELSFVVLMASNLIILPVFLMLALTSLILTPYIVRRSLAGVSRIAKEAEEIDTQKRGRRLSGTFVPKEIRPLVHAVNEALDRLDEGYEQQAKFVAFASHELRTPIAILLGKIETAEGSEIRALATDIQRLATVTEQVLDLERLGRNRNDERVDILTLVRGVVGDLAPLVVSRGHSIEVEVLSSNAVATGDAAALERVISNLVLNGIEHGGHHVVVRVIDSGFEVEDDGPGVPEAERERIFEPFYQLHTQSPGSGLGLNLVKQVVDQHSGRVEVSDARNGGTIVRVTFAEI